MAIDRRNFLALTGGVASLPVTPRALAATVRPPWAELKSRLGERLAPVRSPLVAVRDSGGKGADALFAAMKNPYFNSDDAGLTQTLGWTDAWTSAPSTYVVAAEGTLPPLSVGGERYELPFFMT